MLIYTGWARVVDATLGESGTEETAIRAWDIASVDYGRTRVGTTTCLCVFFVGVLAVDPTAFRA